MPTVDDVFGGTTLRASDIKGKNPVVTIQTVSVKEFKDKDGSTKKKLIIEFAGAKKSLVCNVTNAKRIAHLHGDDYTLWPGKKIKLQSEMVNFGNEVTDGIRVYPQSDPIESGRQPMKSELNDDIPF